MKMELENINDLINQIMLIKKELFNENIDFLTIRKIGEEFKKSLDKISLSLKKEYNYVNWEKIEEFLVNFSNNQVEKNDFIEEFDEYYPMLIGKLIVIKNNIKGSF
jgi:hypothetical protein